MEAVYGQTAEFPIIKNISFIKPILYYFLRDASISGAVAPSVDPSLLLYQVYMELIM